LITAYSNINALIESICNRTPKFHLRDGLIGMKRVEVNIPRSINDEFNMDLVYRPRPWNMSDELLGNDIPGPIVDLCLIMSLYYDHILKYPTCLSLKNLQLYIPKIESQYEGKLWKKIFQWLEDKTAGKIKITCILMVENTDALYHLNDILDALQGYVVCVNTGAFDYIGSIGNRHWRRLGGPMSLRSNLNYKQSRNIIFARTCSFLWWIS